MPIKLKPSTKEHARDNQNKIIDSKWSYVHYTPSDTKTEELLKLLASPAQKKNKRKIQNELTKRGVKWEN